MKEDNNLKELRIWVREHVYPLTDDVAKLRRIKHLLMGKNDDERKKKEIEELKSWIYINTSADMITVHGKRTLKAVKKIMGG